MQRVRKYSALALLIFCVSAHLSGQVKSGNDNLHLSSNKDSGNYKPFVVYEIEITGNKKTRPYIIERELPFKRGDSVNLAELVNKFEEAKIFLMNTALFHDVVIYLKKFEGYRIYVSIELKERWYLFPIPYFKPVDRNLSEWAKQGYGFNRVNFGLKLYYNNFSGQNDKLKVWLITGYTQQLQFQYELPYMDKALKFGSKLNFSYSSNKEVNYATINNQQVFFDTTYPISKQYTVGYDLTYRPYIKTRHTFRISYTHQLTDSVVLNKNPKYYLNSVNKVSYPEISYRLEYADVDYNPYPLKGQNADFSILKRGINDPLTRMWQLTGRGSIFKKLSSKTSFGTQVYGILRLPLDQPFINQRLFGYSDFYLRGLEKYVVDGVGAVLFRNTIRTEILGFSILSPLPSAKAYKIPFRVFVKAYADAGYTYNRSTPDNSLSNRMLYTTGAGVDLVTFYDLILRFEYSFNQLGQSGFFFHVKNDF